MITARNTDIGALIGASTTQRELFHIASTHKLRVYVNIPQDYSRYEAREGLEADIELKEMPGQRFKGTVVRTSRSIDPTSRTLLAEIDLDNPAGELLPGLVRGGALEAADAREHVPPPGERVDLPGGGRPRRGRQRSACRAGAGDARTRFRQHRRSDLAGLTGDESVIVNPAGLADLWTGRPSGGRCRGPGHAAVKRAAPILIRAGAVRLRQQSHIHAAGAIADPASVQGECRLESGAAGRSSRARRVVGSLSGRAAERARGPHRRVERDPEGATGAVRAGACRDRNHRADRYPQVTTSPSITQTESSANRANAIARQRISEYVLPVDVSYEADVWGRDPLYGRRQPCERAGERCGSGSPSGCRCTPSSRSTTSSCVASRPTNRSSTPPSRRFSVRSS